MTPLTKWANRVVSAAVPAAPIASVVEWCRLNCRLPGSARSEAYDPDITPWTKAPLEMAGVPRSKTTFVAPIQSGKSAAGELAICKWIATENGGDCNYYWQNDEKAGERWATRFERILLACDAVTKRISERGAAGIPELRRVGKWTKGAVQFPHMNLNMLGVNTARNVASESVRFEVNEEIHDKESGWEPGRLEQCYGRTTAYWNSVILNISNAGFDGDQLHAAFLSGTQEHWEVKCPGCGQFHSMRTRWEDEHPELGGLRYDADACRMDGGDINYQKLLPTIRYQMPCGYCVHDDNTERRALSLSGRYSEPRNPGALATERSFTFEAVAIDYIPWVNLIKQKHLALKAMRNGDIEPWFTYLRERECRFPKRDEDRPLVQRIELSSAKKDRKGLPNRLLRVGALDYQLGSFEKGELPHWWGLVQDIAIEKRPATEQQAQVLGAPVGTIVDVIHVLTVWEGKLLTDSSAAEIMERHEVEPGGVVVDSGHNAPHVYQFCLEHGFNAIKGEETQRWPHTVDGQKVYRIWSPERPLHLMINQPRTRANPREEPLYWFYSNGDLMKRLLWLRTSPLVHYEVPSDVSKDFLSHMEAWSLDEVKKSGKIVMEFRQHKKRDDLYKCACYCAMLFEMAGYIGASAFVDEPTEQKEKE